MSFIRKLREARIQAELERLYLKESMEEAERMDPECETYQRCKQEVESFMAWHKDATVEQFYERYLSMHGHEENLNLMLPLVIVSRKNEEEMAKI